jgi:hypothetical protein
VDRVVLGRVRRIRAPPARPDGLGPVRKIDLGQPPSFFYSPRWSPTARRSRTPTSA